MPPILFRQKLLLGFLPVIAMMMGIAWFSYKTVEESRQASDLAEQSILIISKAHSISSKTVKWQHHERTNSQWRGPKAAIDSELHALQLLVSDKPAQVYRLKKLGSTIALLDSLNSDAQTAEPFSRKHHRLDSANTVISEMVNTFITNEEKLLTVSQKRSDRHITNAIRLIFISSFVTIATVISLIVFTLRTFRAKRKLREELQLSERKFYHVFNDSGIGMAIVSLEGKWLQVNNHISKILGYSADELMAKTYQEITYQPDMPLDDMMVARVLKGEMNTCKFEKRYYHKNGQLVWVLLTVSLIYNEDGTPGFFVSQLEDISEIKKMISELEMKNKSLVRISEDLKGKVSQLEEFNRIVAHNLRGPASSIEMMLSMLTDAETSEEKDELMHMILVSSKTLNTTLNDLMQILEIRLNHDIPYDICDLQEITDKTSNLLQGELLKAKALIQTNFKVPTVSFPKIYLESIFYNLISNSIKYRKQNQPATIFISSEPLAGQVRLTFQDNGIGIDLNMHGKNMFKLNKVFHKGYNSRGVGLFITKNQLETHGGSIRVESQPGVGTTFIIYLNQT
ncbi:PAS domain S-box protein [Mucilaginibacter sp. RS28]|uniref:histidine kinase n=1 Tax=Mucilaginibacter straminoryzae TaxID=2932774 RepID=A0A9X2BA94_9SPHI|nr:HAMP domain-containing sensor histidine kinase [Mucilaginibacter straminoryzae]MCJ8210555.1 PAS domain S-box protein [Mucilaginibacter straminoryzae]